MLLSMTGFGDARLSRDPLEIRVELRAVNNRYFKLNCRLPDLYSGLESRIEKLVRGTISRGTVTLSISRSHTANQVGDSFDRRVIEQYLEQWNSLRREIPDLPGILASDLLQLEGVVAENDVSVSPSEQEWATISETIQAALGRFQEFRIEEGNEMTKDLRSQLSSIDRELQKVSERAPLIVEQYRDRTVERVGGLLGEYDVQIERSDIIKEVSVFADRCDINEEIIRLRAHLGQFETFLSSDNSEGKRLDFLSQEMNREINTIGSKANDVEVAHCVVEMKAAVEKIREVLQNVE